MAPPSPLVAGGHDRSSSSKMFFKISVLKNLAKFTGKHLCQSFFFNKVTGPRTASEHRFYLHIMYSSHKVFCEILFLMMIKKFKESKRKYFQKEELHMDVFWKIRKFQNTLFKRNFFSVAITSIANSRGVVSSPINI